MLTIPTFPKIFIEGVMPQEATKELLIADGLEGWALCMSGNKPPEKFGMGMALISQVLGSGLPEDLSKMANEFLKK